MPGEIPFLDLDAIETGGNPACEFQFYGRMWHTRPKDDIPWGMMKGFAEAQASGDEGRVIAEIGPFFRAVMDPAEMEDFFALTDDNDEMTIKRFQALVGFVSKAVFGGVPTQPSRQSAPGRPPIGPSSRESSFSPVRERQTT